MLQTPRGARYVLSQRAEHVWEGVSSATTRSRPIINTRDEPHADAEKYRRLHVIVGDSNMSETTTLLKVASADLVLRMIEARTAVPDLVLENPIRAIREMSHDLTGRAPVRLVNGRTIGALDMQIEYLSRASLRRDRRNPSPRTASALDLWERTLKAVESGDHSGIERTIDWAIKKRMLDRYMQRHDLALEDPRIGQLDLSYHDIRRGRGLFTIMEARGAVERITKDIDVLRAKSTPPQTTRAKLRGDFVRKAQDHRRDFTVDWVHLKLNDQAQRTVLCRDPFAAVDERVDRLIESIH